MNTNDERVQSNERLEKLEKRISEVEIMISGFYYALAQLGGDKKIREAQANMRASFPHLLETEKAKTAEFKEIFGN